MIRFAFKESTLIAATWVGIGVYTVVAAGIVGYALSVALAAGSPLWR